MGFLIFRIFQPTEKKLFMLGSFIPSMLIYPLFASCSASC